MAKRSNYHGFDEAKNIVEAPKLYLTGTEAGKNTANTTDLITCFAEEEGSLTLELTNGSALPGSHVGATFAYQPGDTGKDRYLIFYDAINQELWIGGATETAWKPWKQLATVEYVKNKAMAGTVKVYPSSSTDTNSATVTVPNGAVIVATPTSMPYKNMQITASVSGTTGTITATATPQSDEAWGSPAYINWVAVIAE